MLMEGRIYKVAMPAYPHQWHYVCGRVTVTKKIAGPKQILCGMQICMPGWIWQMHGPL